MEHLLFVYLFSSSSSFFFLAGLDGFVGCIDLTYLRDSLTNIRIRVLSPGLPSLGRMPHSPYYFLGAEYISICYIYGIFLLKQSHDCKYSKILLLRCIHHFKSDLINNMGHMRILDSEPSCLLALHLLELFI